MDNNQLQELHDALIDAFPTEQDLASMVYFQLGENLETITGSGSLRDKAFNLILRWAEPRDKVNDLIKGALKANPTNEKLRKVAIEFGVVETVENIGKYIGPVVGLFVIIVICVAAVAFVPQIFHTIGLDKPATPTTTKQILTAVPTTVRIILSTTPLPAETTTVYSSGESALLAPDVAITLTDQDAVIDYSNSQVFRTGIDSTYCGSIMYWVFKIDNKSNKSYIPLVDYQRVHMRDSKDNEFTPGNTSCYFNGALGGAFNYSYGGYAQTIEPYDYKFAVVRFFASNISEEVTYLELRITIRGKQLVFRHQP